jgi:hypothetical protein
MNCQRFTSLLVAALLPLGANAQLEGMIKGGGKDQLKGLPGLSGQSLSSGSMGNVAGLLQYCVSNNYLGGENVASVQDKLMGKLPGGTKSNDPGYNDGLKGVLHSGNGQQVDLNTGSMGSSGTAGNTSGVAGMKEQVTKQVCDTVLSQAKSFL